MLRSYAQGFLLLSASTRIGVLSLCFGVGLAVGTVLWWRQQTFPVSEPVSISLKNSDFSVFESTPSAEVVVGVVGQVKKPGIYTVLRGSRVAEVIEKAGGVVRREDEEDPLVTVNIAEIVADGQTIAIGRGVVTSAVSENEPKKIQINSASKSEIDSIPGIGEKYAEELLQKRPFISTQDTQEKTNIPDGLLSKLEPYISYEMEKE